MCIIEIPYFKEITIMSFNCEHCGVKNSDVKAGGGITEKGILITLDVKSENDLKREVFKSDTAGVKIPELELEIDYGTLGGVFTTVEGLLEKISDNLKDNNPFGDSDSNYKKKLDELFAKLDTYREGKTPFTLVMEDLLENSFIQNPNHPKEDLNCRAIKFKRDTH
jgi:zinc finger protein